MGNKHKLASRNQQDKLEEGLLKTDSGIYIPIEGFGTNDANGDYTFKKLKNQDKLKEGLVKTSDKSYISPDGLEGVTKRYPVEISCFVATAVYGDVNAPQVQILREFKDNVLAQSHIGRAFIDFYYSGAGKKAADFIRDHVSSTVPLIRKGLDTLVERYSAQRK